MPRIEINIKEKSCICECDFCGDKFTIANDIKKFREILLNNVCYCWKCSRYIAETPIRNLEANRGNEEEQERLWNKLRRFQVITTMIPELDEELKTKFGDWKVEPQPLWRT